MAKKKEEKVEETKVEETKVEEEKIEETKEEVKEEVKTEPVVEAPKKKKSNAGVIIAIVCAVVLTLVLLGTIFGVLFVRIMADKKPVKQKEKVEVVDYSSPYRLSGNGLEDFDLYFLQLENAPKNKVYSPLSIKYALAMLNEGTDGASHEQIASLIGDYQPRKYNNNEHMSFANVFFIRESFSSKIQESYKQNLQEKYGAEVIIDPFTSPQPMNDWVSQRTFGLIDSMVDDDYVREANFILANAVAIDMYWVNQIHCATGAPDGVKCIMYQEHYPHEKLAGEDREYSTTSYPYTDERYFPSITFNGKENGKSSGILATFNKYDIVKELGEDKIREEVGAAYREWLEKEKEANSSDYEYAEKDVDKYLDGYVEAINSNYGKEAISTDFSFYVDDDVKVFAKDLQTYDGVTLQYVGIMPTNVELTEYVKNTDAESINELIRNLKELKGDSFNEGVVTRITGKIPLFKYDYELNLEEDLQQLGVKDIFDINKSNLEKMIKDEQQYIDASHQATIEFSNDGIKAAAVTTMGGFGSSTAGFNYLFEVPVEEINMTFDKPFMYLVRDKDTGEVWFTGTVYEVVQKQA